MLFDQRYSRLFDDFPEPVFLIDPEGNILEANASFSEQIGLEPGRHFGANVYEQLSSNVHPHYFPDLAELQRCTDEAVRSGSPVSFETVRGKTDCIYSIYPLRYAGESTIRLLVFVNDLTREKKTVRKRRDDLSDLNALSINALNDSIPASIIVIDAHMRLIGWNRFSQSTINGRHGYEMFGINPFERVHPEDRLDIINRAFLNVIMFDVEESANFRMFHKDAPDYRWATLRTRRAVIGGQPCVIAVVTETTELKMAEDEQEHLQEKLQQAQKLEMLGQLAGGMADEFYNILGVISGNAELAIEFGDSNDMVKSNLREILGVTERMTSLVRHLIAFARQEIVEPKIIKLDDAIADIVPLLRRFLDKNIQLSWNPASFSTMVCIDASQLDQIISNLVINARDAIADCGTISIGTGWVQVSQTDATEGHPCLTPGDFIRITVSDTGCGIDSKTLPHIFEPFFSTKDVGKGSGLGLSTIYGILKQNNGYIDCQTRLGRGTTFSIYLPVYHLESMEARKRTRDREDGRSKATILLVEDEPDILKLVKIVLERNGFTVLEARDAETAVRIAGKQQGNIDLLITDVMLPGMNGIELADCLQSEHPGLKILFMSGYAAGTFGDPCMLESGVNFISKPFSIKKFLSAVHAVLSPNIHA
jgi:two-component system, cell cycle sensor histidine kinase and response regulator CckA